MKRLLLITLLFMLASCQTEATPDPTSLPTTAPIAEIATNTPLPTTVPPTNPPPPTITTQPTATRDQPPATSHLPPATDTPIPPTATPEPTLNGLPLSQLIIIPPEVRQNVQQIYANGQTIGRYPGVFSKLGDSVIANGDFLTRFDTPGDYTLGPYDYMQPTIDYYNGSWVRYGVGIRIGLSAWGVFDPMWADKDWCSPNETMIDCEIRLNNPAVMLIHLGTNDIGDNFEEFYRRTVEYAINAGIVPVLITKSDRFEGEDNRNNIAIRQAAEDFNVPLVDFDVVADTLPNRGLKDGDVHLNGPFVHDYNLSEVYEKGHTVHNLVVLMMLHEIRLELGDG